MPLDRALPSDVVGEANLETALPRPRPLSSPRRLGLPNVALGHAMARFRCWIRGTHRYVIVAFEQLSDDEFTGRLACRDCDSEPPPEEGVGEDW